MTFLCKLTGGRSMHRNGSAFTDTVVKKPVYYWIDRLGRHWMAFGRWSLFRVEPDPLYGQNPSDNIQEAPK